jgi:hypothetical protein
MDDDAWGTSARRIRAPKPSVPWGLLLFVDSVTPVMRVQIWVPAPAYPHTHKLPKTTTDDGPIYDARTKGSTHTTPPSGQGTHNNEKGGTYGTSVRVQ